MSSQVKGLYTNGEIFRRKEDHVYSRSTKDVVWPYGESKHEGSGRYVRQSRSSYF